jgi:hypothetical protein
LQDRTQLVFFPAEHIHEFQVLDDLQGFFRLPVKVFIGGFTGLEKLVYNSQVLKGGFNFVIGIGPSLNVADGA